MKNKELLKLAKLFNKKNAVLYVVGGFVRDEQNGDVNDDIDIASNLTSVEVKEVCEKKFNVVEVSKKLGTLVIEGKNMRAEYTPFRSEEYASKFSHSPSKVNFEKDILKDAYRRDFTVNSMYKNILTGEIFDPYSGKKDIEKKLIRQIHDQVFDVDPLRIFRMVRFASVLDYKIEAKTFASAKKNAYKIAGLSRSRISEEFKKLLAGNNCVYAIEKLMELGILPKKEIPTFRQNKSLTSLAYDLFGKNEKKLEEFLMLYTESNKQKDEILSAIAFANKFDKEKKIASFIGNEANIENARVLVKNSAKFEKCLDEIGDKKLPLSVLDLDITGDDLKKLGINGASIGKELNRLVVLCVEGKIKNKKQELEKHLLED